MTATENRTVQSTNGATEHQVAAELRNIREDKFSGLGLTFDDVLLLPAESNVLPNEVSTATRFAGNIHLHIPIISSAMDTVTEGRMACALAREGGIGVVHRNLSIEQQVAESFVVRCRPGIQTHRLLQDADRLAAPTQAL